MNCKRFKIDHFLWVKVSTALHGREQSDPKTQHIINIRLRVFIRLYSKPVFNKVKFLIGIRCIPKIISEFRIKYRTVVMQ